MNKGSVPTAIAAIVVIAICCVCYMTIKDKVEKNKLEQNEIEAREIGDLPKIRVSIGGKTYYAKLESNKTAKSFFDILPLNITLKTKDTYSKKGYTYVKLTSTANKIKKIKAGDIVLAGESEILLFFKDYNNSGDKFSIIGHIDNIKYIDDDQVTVGFNKVDK